MSYPRWRFSRRPAPDPRPSRVTSAVPRSVPARPEAEPSRTSGCNSRLWIRICHEKQLVTNSVLLWGPLIPLFWTSDDISSRFQNQSGQPYSHLAEVYIPWVWLDCMHWVNLLFWVKISYFWSGFFLGNFLLFLGNFQLILGIKQKIDYFWACFYHRPALVFKSLHFAWNTLYFML